jgi:hypothetical protein
MLEMMALVTIGDTQSDLRSAITAGSAHRSL